MTTSAREVASGLRTALGGELPKVKKHKLLYYAQAWHLVWFGRRLFDEDLEAWQNGPVVAELWREEKGARPSVVHAALPETAETVIRYVAARYGFMTGAELIDRTHDEDPWRVAWDPFTKSALITDEALVNYFSADDASDQSWIWSPAWMSGELEASEEIDLGLTTVHHSLDDFLDSLR